MILNLRCIQTSLASVLFPLLSVPSPARGKCFFAFFFLEVNVNFLKIYSSI